MSHIKEFEHLKIQLEAIKLATNNFAAENCIGRGGFGKVYKGEIIHSKGQSVVAFKRLDRAFGQGNPEFWKEIMMLSIYKHQNVVSLLGFCDESDEKILLYEYAAKRSLDLYLNDDNLTWIQRLKICIGAASGLAYLHNPVGDQLRVLHRDIKSSNILLDENWNAMISDFGLSKFGPANQMFTFLISQAVGTIGYCDPLYVETGFLSKESDVYSFGVVLFEVLSGRLCYRNDIDNDRLFAALAQECYEQNKLDAIIYGNMKDDINPSSLKVFTAIAYQCLKRDRKERPLTTEIVRELQTALRYQVNEESWKPIQLSTLTQKYPNSDKPFLFNMLYFEHRIQAGEWDEAERCISGLTKIDDNRWSMKMFFEIRKQKYYEALDRNDRQKAVEMLRKELRVFSSYNEALYKEMTQLITLDNFREHEQLSMYGDTKSSRLVLLLALKKLIKENPLFKGKVEFSGVRRTSQTRLRAWDQEVAFFFNMKYFEDRVQAGEWDEVERYLCRFTEVAENPSAMQIFFEIRKQKCLKTLCSNHKAKDVEILVKDLKAVSTFNQEHFMELSHLITLEDYRLYEYLSNYEDTKSARNVMLVEVTKLIEVNPLFRDIDMFHGLMSDDIELFRDIDMFHGLMSDDIEF